MQENNYHHEEVMDIMVSSPGWGLKWGNSIIFSIIFMILCFTYIFKYPDTVNIPASFSSLNEVSLITAAPVNYGIDTFLVSNGATVRAKAPLLVWYDENHSSYHTIIALENILKKYEQNRKGGGAAAGSLLQQLSAIGKDDLGSVGLEYQALLDELKHPSGLLPEQCTRVLNFIDQWKKKQVVLSKIGGRVTFNYLSSQAKSPVHSRDPILFIQPPGAKYVVKGLVSNKLFGKINIGQEAYVTVNELNNKRFYGRVTGISPLADHKFNHDIYIALNQSPALNFTYTGEARIILQDKPLLARIFNLNK